MSISSPNRSQQEWLVGRRRQRKLPPGRENAISRADPGGGPDVQRDDQ